MKNSFKYEIHKKKMKVYQINLMNFHLTVPITYIFDRLWGKSYRLASNCWLKHRFIVSPLTYQTIVFKYHYIKISINDMTCYRRLNMKLSYNIGYTFNQNLLFWKSKTILRKHHCEIVQTGHQLIMTNWSITIFST